MTDSPITAFAIAITITESGFTGVNLSKLLMQRFPTARRYDFALGAAIAFSDVAVDLVCAEAELRALRAELEAVRAAARPLSKVAA